jgi:aminoacrylate hydrolase
VPYAPISCGELYYEVSGQGPPVVFAAGLGGLGSFWHPHCETLASRFTVVTYDHRGSGQSTKSPPPYTIDAMVHDVLSLLDHLGFSAVRFVGHSTGGAIGQCLASRWPARIERLVLSSTWTHCDAYFRRLFTLRRDIVAQSDTDIYARLTTLLLYPPEWVLAHDEVIADKGSRLNAVDRAILAGKIDALLGFDGREGLATIRCPTLIIAARDDATIPSYFSQALLPLIHTARLSLLDAGGHYFPITRAHEFGIMLSEFLELHPEPQS